MLLLTELVVCRRSWRPTATDNDQPTRPEMMLLKIMSVIDLCWLSVTSQQLHAENQQVVGWGRVGCWLQTYRQKDQQPTLNIALSFGSLLSVATASTWRIRNNIPPMSTYFSSQPEVGELALAAVRREVEQSEEEVMAVACFTTLAQLRSVVGWRSEEGVFFFVGRQEKDNFEWVDLISAGMRRRQAILPKIWLIAIPPFGFLPIAFHKIIFTQIWSAQRNVKFKMRECEYEDGENLN